MNHTVRRSFRFAGLLVSAGLLVAAIGAWTRSTAGTDGAGSPPSPASPGDVMRGRNAVITHDCGGCHGGFANPESKGWLAGAMVPDMEFRIPPSCAWTPGAKPCFTTRPRNLTPDNATGLGRFTERQIHNALKYGLRPEDTPDVDITSTTPGKGNFPLHPKYLAPPMPWTTWRYLPEQELWDIAAYLKRGVKPVVNKVADSEGPPDFWAGEYAKEDVYGKAAVPAFPTANERKP
jgi:mono/diheme cytochrome c family protein